MPQASRRATWLRRKADKGKNKTSSTGFLIWKVKKLSEQSERLLAYNFQLQMFKNIQKEWIHPSPSHRPQTLLPFGQTNPNVQVSDFQFLAENSKTFKTETQRIKYKEHQDNCCQASHADKSPVLVPKKSSRVEGVRERLPSWHPLRPRYRPRRGSWWRPWHKARCWVCKNPSEKPSC